MPAAPSPTSAFGASAELDALEEDFTLSERWRGSRFVWVKTARPQDKGRVGERLFDRLCAAAGVAVDGRNGKGHDRRVGGVKVEVKLSTLYDTANPDDAYYQWLQLRPADDYDLVVLIGVDPDALHVWVVDKASVLTHAVGQHGGKDATETRKLALAHDARPAWLGPDLAADAAGFAAALSAGT